MTERTLEVVKFNEINYLPADPADTVDIGQIGGGVVYEIAEKFKVSGDVTSIEGLDNLIAKASPKPTLQENIAHAKEALGPEAIDIARDWVQRTGLLEPVERSFMDAEAPLPISFTLAVIAGGVANVMNRRANALLNFDGKVEQVLMLGGKGRSGFGELTQSEYLGLRIRTVLINAGFEPVVNKPVNSESGNEVMKAGVGLVPESGPILIAGNPGNWLQVASQFRRAMRQTYPDFDQNGERLFVVSDTIELGETGMEPTSTHQNPLSAIGAITRNLKQVKRSLSE